MELKDRVIVVTGAARGIGRALATRFASAEPLAVFIADIDGPRLTEVAREIGATASAISATPATTASQRTQRGATTRLLRSRRIPRSHRS